MTNRQRKKGFFDDRIIIMIMPKCSIVPSNRAKRSELLYYVLQGFYLLLFPYKFFGASISDLTDDCFKERLKHGKDSIASLGRSFEEVKSFSLSPKPTVGFLDHSDGRWSGKNECATR